MASSLPALGARWGDLSAEQRRLLPVGTKIAYPHISWAPVLVKCADSRWRPEGSARMGVHDIDRRILSYPESTP